MWSVEKNWNTFVSNDTILFVVENKEKYLAQSLCEQSRCLNKSGHWKGRKLIYNRIKGKEHGYFQFLCLDRSCLETNILLVIRGENSISSRTVIGYLSSRERDTYNYLINRKLRGPVINWWRNKFTFYTQSMLIIYEAIDWMSATNNKSIV